MKNKFFLMAFFAITTIFVGCTNQTTNINNSNKQGLKQNINAIENINIAVKNNNLNTSKAINSSIPNYQTYTNDAYGYSFQFPATWSAAKTEYEAGLMKIILMDESNKEILTITNPHLGTGFETFETESTKEIAMNYPDTEISSQILVPISEEIDAKNLGMAFWQLGCNSKNRQTCQQESKDSGIIIMTISNDEEIKQENIRIFYNILESIKFIK